MPQADITFDWTKHPLQEPFVFDDRRFLIWVGGRGSTKTSSACFHIFRLVHDPAFHGARWIMAAPISKQLKEGPLHDFDEWFDPTGIIVHKINGNEPRRDLINGWTILAYNVGPDGQGSEAWRGLQVAGAWLDEAAQMPEKAFNLANAACRQTRADGTHFANQTLLTTTPRGENWLDRRFLNPHTRKTFKDEDGNAMYPDEKVGVYRSTTKMSIEAGFLKPDYISNIGYAPGTKMYEQEIEGKVVAWAGLVFPYFDVNRHCPDPCILPRFKYVFGGVDIGISTSHTAIELVGVDERNRLWCFKEYYERGGKLSTWMPIVQKWQWEHHVTRWFVDAAFHNEIATMKAAGIIAKPSMKARDAAGTAVNFLNDLMARDQTDTSSGFQYKEPQFFVGPECPGLKSEMLEYEYKEHLVGNEVTFLEKVKPAQSDHAIDAMRYAALPLMSAGAQQQYGQVITGRYG